MSAPSLPVLFFVSLGDQHEAVRSWLRQAKSFGDIAIAYYGETRLPTEDEALATVAFERRDFKISNFRHLLTEDPNLLDRYSGVFFIDDDIIFPEGGMAAFFDAVRRENLSWAQPSIDPAGSVHWPHLAHRPGAGVVISDFLEIAVFYVEARLLRLTWPYMQKLRTGLGLDFALMHVLARNGLRAGVVHDVVVQHPERDEAKTVRGLFPGWSAHADALLEELRADLRTPLSLVPIVVMSHLFGRVDFRTLHVLQIAHTPVRWLWRRLGLHKRAARTD